MKSDRLIPCGGCSRHVRCCEAACPFCGAAISTSQTAPTQEPFRRMAAAAAVAAGVASLGGCSSSSAIAFYGSPQIYDSGNPNESEGGTDAGVGADGMPGLTDAVEEG